MSSSLRKMNNALYKTSLHLIEASKYLSDVPEFEDQSALLIMMADALINVIQPETPKMTKENMESILDEIAAIAGDPS